MNRIYTAILMLVLPFLVSAQELIAKNPKALKGQLLKASGFQAKTVRTEQGIIGGRPEIGQYKPPVAYPQLQQKEDGALMSVSSSSRPSPSPYTSFDGMGFTNVCPADPTIAVSSNYIVQMINAGPGAQLQVYSKTGSPMGGPVLLGDITKMQGLGDCIALYDQYHDRFIVSELAYADNGIIVAVSQTSDPRGNYNSYFFHLASAPDYPKYSVWNGVLYAKTNNFTGNSFNSISVFAFDLFSMAGGATQPQGVQFDLPASNQHYSMCPVGLVGTTNFGSGGLFAYMSDNAWTGSTTDSVGLLKLVPDFSASPATGTLSLETKQAVSGFDPGVRSISQPGGKSLDALSNLVMNQPICRAFTSSSAELAMAFTVNVSTRQAGVRWTVLNNQGGNWSLAADGTYSGSDGQNRWIPSVNIDVNGNVGLGFNISGPKTFPSIGNIVLSKSTGYTASQEYVIAAGKASSVCFGRYGDYNHLVIDPSNGSTFWFTAMYNVAPGWSTRIGSFSAATSNHPVPGIVQRKENGQMSLSAANRTLVYPNPVRENAVVELPAGFNHGRVEMFDASGRGVGVQNISGSRTNVNMTTLHSGIYMLKVTSAKGVDYLKLVKQ